jgi:hypothetical protein
MRAIVHSADEIMAMLRRGLAPMTDNRDALLGLGFERSYPHVAAGYYAKIWERAVESPYPSSTGARMLIRERAFLEKRP